MGLLAGAIWEKRQASEGDTSAFDLSSLISQFPRGSISEIVGPPSSGRTSLMQAVLRNTITHGEVCALIDWADSFDPASAMCNGIVLEQVLWVRGGRKPPGVAVKIADHLLHIGGFGIVVLDLCDVDPSKLRSIPLSWWYRLRKTLEHTVAMLTIVAREPITGPCASRVIDMQSHRTVWSGSSHFPLLSGSDLKAVVKKPLCAASVPLHASLAG